MVWRPPSLRIMQVRAAHGRVDALGLLALATDLRVAGVREGRPQ